MKINTNTWNKIRYTLYTPGYDFIASFLRTSRGKSIASLNIREGDKILIVGAGTGLDLEFLPIGCEITATDITPSMVDRIKRRAGVWNRKVQTLVMDGQSLDFADNSFDIVILHLILAVIPNPVACIKEVERVLKPGGQVAIYDKFVRKNRKVSVTRKVVNVITNLLFSDITRDFESIVKHTALTVVLDNGADLNGNFRLIQLKKNEKSI
jgi:ubiquinone/menaquinone biosynthesis C-methylase UbiE